MSNAAVGTRPERTGREIAIDRKAANAFFARMNRWSKLSANRARDLRRLLERESHDWNLRCCTAEGRVWAAANASSPSERAHRTAERIAADPLAHRDASQLRHYVPATTEALMPRTRLHPISTRERARSTESARRYWVRVTHRRDQVLLDGRTPFAQWLLANPRYGPVRPAPVDDSSAKRRARYGRYKSGEVHIVGMTAESAIQIAMGALDKR